MTDSDAPKVECYSGHTYAQEPRALTWEGQRYVIAEVEARWRLPDGPAYRVRAGSGKRFDLQYYESGDRWTIVPLTDGESGEE